MKRIITIVTLSLISLILISCANGRYPYPKKELGVENWRSQVDVNPGVWAMHADEWFLAGGPTRADIENQEAGSDAAISTTRVRVANFRGIKASGNFQIQISGDPDQNTVCIEGPNQAVRAIAVNVNNNILCLEQLKGAPNNMDQVIVHISMRQLEYLEHNGLGSVEGVRLESRHLNILAAGCGNIFLAGHMNVKSIVANGPGTVNIFTIRSDGTSIETSNEGSVNFSARDKVWLCNVKHKGSGNINVIGAVSGGLVVNAEGKGKIGLLGNMNVNEVRASGKTCVFITRSDSASTHIYVYDSARVGIDGRVYSFNGYTTKSSRLLARNLIARDSYVKATGESHMNVNATNTIFASATDYATIYFYGDPNILTSFVGGDGSVVNMGRRSSENEAIVPLHAKRYEVRRYCATGVKKRTNYLSSDSREYTWHGRPVSYIK